jgi:hypothetical protein
MLTNCPLHPLSDSVVREWFPWFLKSGTPLYLLRVMVESKTLQKNLKWALKGLKTLFADFMAETKKFLPFKHGRRKKVIASR